MSDGRRGGEGGISMEEGDEWEGRGIGGIRRRERKGWGGRNDGGVYKIIRCVGW